MAYPASGLSVGARRISALAVGSLVAFLGGCAVGPDYERPEVPMPEDWRVDSREAADLANTRWWNRFEDPVLDDLIETALAENRDIRQAAARVDQFLGGLRTTRAEFFPQVTYEGDVSRNRLSEDGYGFSPGADPYFNQYAASLGASWQIDLFGRVRRQTEAAQARVYASEQGRRGVILSVVAGVASTYITLRGLDRQLEISMETAASYERTLDIFRLRYRYGTVSRLELSQVESQYHQARAAIPSFEAQIAAQENLLSILLGRNSRDIIRGRAIENLPLPEVPDSLPSDLLERRPDILQAEQNLVAANAEIGVARSLYYPDIAITGAYGAVSTDLDDFLDSSARTWNIGANVLGPIFTAGSIAGTVQSAEAARQQAEEFYRGTILNALKEVNDALVSTQKNAEAYDSLSLRVNALRDYARLADLRFEAGAASYLEVLYANQELFIAELEAVNARVGHYTSLVDVYRSMGGGWVDDASMMAPTPQEVMSQER
jgi:multidrug efflux system outer membrane protein